MASTSITVRMDEDLKKRFEFLLDDMGLTMTTAITLFAKAIIRQNKLPFDVIADPFYSDSNQERLKAAVTDLKGGINTVSKTIEELMAMEDE